MPQRISLGSLSFGLTVVTAPVTDEALGIRNGSVFPRATPSSKYFYKSLLLICSRVPFIKTNRASRLAPCRFVAVTAGRRDCSAIGFSVARKCDSGQVYNTQEISSHCSCHCKKSDIKNVLSLVNDLNNIEPSDYFLLLMHVMQFNK